jgi:hypothetical protein
VSWLKLVHPWLSKQALPLKFADASKTNEALADTVGKVVLRELPVSELPPFNSMN